MLIAIQPEKQDRNQPTNQPTNQPSSSSLKSVNGKQRIHIDRAIEYLDQHFERIPSVEDWSQLMGYPNRQVFWRKFDACFYESPQTMYIRKKIQVLINYVRSNPECTAKEAALAIHHKNGNELYQFVTTKVDCTFTELKDNILVSNGTGPIISSKYGDIL